MISVFTKKNIFCLNVKNSIFYKNQKPFLTLVCRILSALSLDKWEVKILCGFTYFHKNVNNSPPILGYQFIQPEQIFEIVSNLNILLYNILWFRALRVSGYWIDVYSLRHLELCSDMNLLDFSILNQKNSNIFFHGPPWALHFVLNISI